jgi:hypothetical protein
MIVFGIFHGGLLLTDADGDRAVADNRSGWIVSPFMADATRLVTVGMLAFALAVLCMTWRKVADAGHTRQVRPQEVGEIHRLIGGVGLIVQAMGLVLFATAIIRDGVISSLTRGYTEFIAGSLQSLFLPYVQLFMAIGSVLAILSEGRCRVVGWWAFWAFAGVAFPLGMRGEVLFPLTVLFALEVRRGFRPRPAAAIAATFTLLTLISAVRQTRQSGVQALFSGDWKMSPVDAVTEMGYSLRPCVEVVSWHAAGEPFRDGVTFIAVPLRMLESIVVPYAASSGYDNRLFNQEIATRVGPIGGSPVAEGYHNFGVMGVVGLMFLFGIVIATFERRASTVLLDAALGVVLIPIFVEIRNSSTHLIPHIAIGLVIVRIVGVAIAGVRVPVIRHDISLASEVSLTSARCVDVIGNPRSVVLTSTNDEVSCFEKSDHRVEGSLAVIAASVDHEVVTRHGQVLDATKRLG